MINMVEGNDKKYFIIDIRFDNKSNEIILKYADGSETREPFILHNLQFYRHKMIEQATNNLPHFLDKLSIYSFAVVLRKYSVIIGGLLSMFLLYNIDIHMIIKIILGILVVLGEIGFYFYNEFILDSIADVASEGLATNAYLKHINNFCYLNEDKEYEFLLPPELIARYGITAEKVEDLNNTIESLKKDGYPSKEINLICKVKEVKLKR